MVRFHVGSDHGGVGLRRMLASALADWKHEVASESGPDSADEKVDYPDIAREVCERVARERGSFGMLDCGTGQGMAICANKMPGIRAGVPGDAFSARTLREHNDANVICLGARVLGSELARTVLEAFVRAKFQGGRHRVRVDKIEAPSSEA